MGPLLITQQLLVVSFVSMLCSTYASSENGAGRSSDVLYIVRQQQLSNNGYDPSSLPVLSHAQGIDKIRVSPFNWLKIGSHQKVPSFKMMKNGWKEEFHERIKRSLAKLKTRPEDKFDMSTTIPAQYIVVVKLNVPVNRTTLLWLRHAFATGLNLPLENVGIYKVKGLEVELFFIKLGHPVNMFRLIDLKTADEIITDDLLQTVQNQVPTLNITSFYPQHDFVIEKYHVKFWMESYFPYVAAACGVYLLLIVSIVVYCCWRKSKKEPLAPKELTKPQQVYYPSIKPDMKDPMMIQPETSPTFVTKGCVTQVQTPPMRVKAKGLLERRGSNASLTIDLNASPEMKRWDGTPPKESTGLEYLLSAGNRLSRRDLRMAVKHSKALYEEFWEIPMNHPEKVYVAGSGMKNRYKTIIPNEHSRVILPDSEWDPLSSYINANYIRGYDGEPHAYVATQGPMSHTIVDFWRMVWAEKAPIIVMITKLKEKGRPKCENYLPEDNSSATFGDIDVKVDRVVARHGYSLRHLLLRSNGEIQHVLHYWYTAWPDHKPPTSPTMLLELIKEVEQRRHHHDGIRTRGPVIVHCSAGIGRTGCFIGISIGIRQLREEHSVDTLGTVCTMRIDRGGMIQTHEQYDFVHQALFEYEKQLEEPIGNAVGD
ncbi:tyrosine-protein phosphatase non-receptor type 5-like [Mizuhopecten yessoensis]|uniref:protein-tyrosine-phosphatase n=1 Tax=Mizuhopecten yessoensis TaxID=6573 RepID=A0A210QUF4_MIZYE|nr:tyrosine-protein phosphatase non-receptor type 5-like [Mizuhopecten yessoensis]OWF52370.1 Receptor-type tyrosine-protein phosphatase R [Mizuhopecten yessoensis]